MLLKKKGNDVFLFQDEEELEECCKNTTNALSDFQDFDVQRYDKRSKRFNKVKFSTIK